MIGNCRQFTTLTCALLRSRGIPARARCGFARYFEPGKYIDHWVVEFLEATDGRWVRFDSQLDAVQQKLLKLAFDTEDLPPQEFLSAAEAWQRCRHGETDASRFGILDMWGSWFVGNNVVRDLAALNKMELLPWDTWGRMTVGSDPDAGGVRLLDEVAEVVVSERFAAVRNLYESDETLRVPDTVYDARFGEPYAVASRAATADLPPNR